MSFSHVTLGVADIDRALAFYRPLMATLGWVEKFAAREPDADGLGPWAGWKQPGADRPLFIITRPFDGDAPAPGNGPMVAFQLDSRSHVVAAHAQALTLGATDEGAPGPRPHYHVHYFGAYLRDPDGNKLCLVCHTAP